MLSKLLFGACACLIPALAQRQYGFNHREVIRDNDVVAQYFPDTDVELLAPAFLYPDTVPEGFHEGTWGPTNDHVLDDFIQSLVQRNPSWMSYHRFCFTSEEGRGFPYLRLSLSDNGTDSTAATDKVRVWIQGAVHGDEPGADQAVLALLGALDANQTWTRSLLEHLDILVLPRYNPDGVYYLQDTFATNYDPNRDHIKVSRQQTRDLKRQFNKFAPHVAVDVHEYTATRQYGRYHHGSDSLFASGKNLNIHKDIRDLSEELFAPGIATALESHGLRWGPYVTGTASEDVDFEPTFTEAGSDAKIGRNALGLSQCVTFLSETRGIQLTDQHFQRRVSTGLVFLMSVLQTAADNAALVYDTVEGSIRAMVEAEETSDIVVTDYSETVTRNLSLIDITDDTIADRPVKFRASTPKIANLTRSRPEAYLIPSGWADLSERLRVLGLEVETLEKEWSGTVEALTIRSAVFDDEYYEGVVRVTLTSEASPKEIEVSAGSFLVSTRQKNAALAFVALEPENIDSFATFNIVPLAAGDEYPVYRVLAG